MFQLSDFSSVLEVSVGLHLIYSFFPEVRKYFQKKHTEIIEHTNTFANFFKDDETKKAIRQIREAMKFTSIVSSDEIQRTNKMFVRISFEITVFSISVLCMAGFLPEATVSFCTILLILLLALLPMPLMLLYGFFIHRKKLKKNKDRQNELLEKFLPKLNEQNIEVLKKLKANGFFG